MIKFQNGSNIETINTKEESKRGYIKGHRLTNQEYRNIVDNEIFQAECNVSKILKELGLSDKKEVIN